MKAVIQRVKRASVNIEGKESRSINQGIVLFLGINKNDDQRDVDYLVEKIFNLRIFEDIEKKMNRSLLDIKGELLIISQFTLEGKCTKGRRPSFDEAAPPKLATKLYQAFIAKSRLQKLPLQTGEFGANMLVSIENDGPVTFIIESKRK